MSTVYEVHHCQQDGIRLYGGVGKAWDLKDRLIVVSGPFETGKTFGLLYKVHAMLWKYPHARALAVRATYKSILSSARVTYDKILGDSTPITRYGGERPEFYTYPNGSMLFFGGLDNPDKLLSSEWDYIYINQAEEIDVNAYELLCARATGRAGNTPYPQVLADCNPSYPGHWILKKHLAGEIVFLEQLHQHNPLLMDQTTGELTPQGQITMSSLQMLTGIRRQRGLLNQWVAAEGIVYDNFSIADNVTEEAEYHHEWPVFWGVDDGYAHGEGEGSAGYHPRVILQAQQRPDGGFNVFDEYVATLELPEKTLGEVLSRPYAMPDLALVDSSAAELRRRLAERGIVSAPGSHRISDGIKVVRRFVCDGNGVRLLKIHPRCKTLIREFQSYRYSERLSSVEAGEPKPEKMDDHTMDALRYLLFNFR